MSEEITGSIDSVVRSILKNLRDQLAGITTGANLAWVELRVVASHAGLAIGLLMVAVAMSIVGWCLLLVTGALVLINIGCSAALAVFSMFLLNMAALLVVCLMLRHTLSSVSFKHTRRALDVATRATDHSG